MVDQAPIVLSDFQMKESSINLETAGALLITDADDEKLQKFAPVYANGFGCEKQENVSSWDEFVELLKKYESIEKLVLLFHGSPGAVEIGSQNKDLSQGLTLFKDDDNIPKISEIFFEACVVAQGLDKLVPFAGFFHASKLSAWSWFLGMKTGYYDSPGKGEVIKTDPPYLVNDDGQKIEEEDMTPEQKEAYEDLLKDYEMQIKKEEDKLEYERKKKIEEFLDSRKEYLMIGSPTMDEIAGMEPGRYEIGIEWFENITITDDDEEPEPWEHDDHKPRISAKTDEIEGNKEEVLKELEKRELDWNMEVPFVNLIIKITSY